MATVRKSPQHPPGRQPDAIGVRPDPVDAVAFAVIGATPITALALSILEVIPLNVGGPLLVGNGLLIGIVLHIQNPTNGRLIGRGLLTGLIAVIVYDGTRLPLVLLGNWPDFIPKIGAWLLDEPGTHWSLGYLWRYLGNGAGMGLTFAMLAPFATNRLGPRQAGFLYGITVWSGLLLTVTVAPDGQDKLFPLTTATLAASLTGHLVYGGILGLALSRQQIRPKTLQNN